jgi:hypothetical protein
MKRLNRFSEWLLRFTSSQKNIDRVALWRGATVAIVGLVEAAVVMVFLMLHRGR